MFIYLPKFLMTFFYSHRPFPGFNMVFSVGGAKSVADIDKRAKPLTFPQIHSTIVTLSALEGGQTPLTTSMGSHGRIGPPGSASALSDHRAVYDAKCGRPQRGGVDQMRTPADRG